MNSRHVSKHHALVASAIGFSLLLAQGCSNGSGSTGSTTPSTTRVVAPSHFTTVDGPGGGATTINGMNNAQTLVGLTTNSGVNSNFLRLSNGTFEPLALGDNAAMANGVNLTETVVGVANGAAFQLVNGLSTAIPPPSSSSSVAFGVNDRGVVVGQSVAASGGTTPGFSFSKGLFTVVGPPPAENAKVINVQGVNNNGVAVGFFSTDGVHQHGFEFFLATLESTVLPDPVTARLTTDPLVLTQFLAVNDNSVAVGYYQTASGSQFGFLFDLTTLTYTFLDAPLAAPVGGVQITQITGIDNQGDVCGFFIDAAGTQHGFLATP